MVVRSYIYGNYGGDIMNFDMATEMAQMEDIEVRTVLVKDDVASASADRADSRRGVAGMVFAFKIGGAKADGGGTLGDVEAVVKKALADTRTMGVAPGACILPAVGKPGFSIGEGEMELGMGIHGEPGVKRGRSSPPIALLIVSLRPFKKICLLSKVTAWP